MSAHRGRVGRRVLTAFALLVSAGCGMTRTGVAVDPFGSPSGGRSRASSPPAAVALRLEVQNRTGYQARVQLVGTHRTRTVDVVPANGDVKTEVAWPRDDEGYFEVFLGNGRGCRSGRVQIRPAGALSLTIAVNQLPGEDAEQATPVCQALTQR